MTHFFERRDRWGNGVALWVLAVMLFVAPLAFWSLGQIHLENDIETWLPHDDPDRKLLTWYIDQFQREDRVLISWEGSTLNDPRVERLARKLEGIVDSGGVRRHGLKQIRSVATPRETIERMVRQGVEPMEAVRRLQGILIGTGPLKVRLTETGRARRRSTLRLLVQRVKSQLALDVDVLPPVTEWIPPEGYFADEPLVTDAPEADKPSFELPPLPAHDFQLRWDNIHAGSRTAQQVIALVRSLRSEPDPSHPEGVRLVEDCFFAPGAPVGISVTLSEAGVADVEGTVAAIRRVAEDVGIPAESLHLGGRPVARSALNHAVLDAVWNSDAPWSRPYQRSIVLLSGLVGTVLAFVLLRGLRLTLLILIVTYYTIILTVALVPVTGGTMNMVLVVMPTLLMVLTISAGIHLANYWKHASQSDPATAVVTATRMARLPCTMASVTTAIGLLSLVTSTLAPVRDFGLYSALGCLLSLAMVLIGLPALLQIWPPRAPKSSEADRSGWRQLGLGLARARIPIMTTALVAFVVCCYGLRWFRTETKAIRYFPDHSRIVQDYHFLEENLANIVPVELLVRFDATEQQRLNFLERMEVVRHIEEGIRKHPEISGALSLADFLKQYKPLPEDAPRMRRLLAIRKAREAEKRIKEGNESDVTRFLREVADDAVFPFNDGRVFRVEKGDEIWRITAQVAIMSDYDYADLANHAQTGDLDEIAKASLKYHAGADHVVTGMVPLFLNTQQAVLVSLIKSFALAFVMIAVVMMVILKSPVAGLLAMVPNLMPVGVVFGLLAWNGLAVDIGTMITASVALGIAVDGTLHLVTWFRDGLHEGKGRHEAVAEALARCGPALWQTTLIIGLGMFMLFPAELLLVSRFGWLMAALIGCAFLGDAIVLSALLAGPLGAVLEKVIQTPNGQIATGSSETEVAADSHTTAEPAHPQGAVAGPHILSGSTVRHRPARPA